MTYIIIISIVLAIYFGSQYWNSGKVNKNTVLCFTGSLGCGKTFLAVLFSIKKLKKMRLKVLIKNAKIWVYNLFNPTGKKKYIAKPKLYSSVPVRVNKSEWSTELTLEHITGKKRLERYSVVLFDEIGQVCSQWQYNNPLVTDEIQTFIRLFRHYVQGYFICTDQSSSNIVKPIRCRINTIYNLQEFKKKFFHLFYKIKYAELMLTEDNVSNTSSLQTTESRLLFDTTNSVKYPYLFGFIPRFKHYDSFCFSELYMAKFSAETIYTRYKAQGFIKIPLKK